MYSFTNFKVLFGIYSLYNHRKFTDALVVFVKIDTDAIL